MRNCLLYFLILLLVVLGFALGCAAQESNRLEASVVIHFGTGKTFLDSGDKAALRQFFQKYETGPNSRIFVVGYTDSIGDKRHNYKLSRKRAQTVRRQIINNFGLGADLVMAVGKGEENPIADNRSAAGRTSNRRTEIYLVNTRLRKPIRVYGPGDPYLSDIKSLLDEVWKQIKKRQLGEALKMLQKARGLGGDHYSDWHAAMGITAFYANAPDPKISSHLATALEIDPFNYKAREYLGRVSARRNVARGEITPAAGLAENRAIRVSSIAQQHEYLRLFKVEPRFHRHLEGSPIDVWECVNSQGERVDYYFDHSGIYDWAFGSGTTGKETPSNPSKTQSPSADRRAIPVSNNMGKVAEGSVGEGKTVWESRIFN